MSQQFYLPKALDRAGLIQRIGTVLSKLPLDKGWTLTLAEFKARRSDQQNKYLWGVVYPTIIKAGGETLAGWEPEELHEYFLGEKWGWGIIEGFGMKRRRPLRRSARLNKAEFAEYLEFIQIRMAEHGIFVPDPIKEMAR